MVAINRRLYEQADYDCQRCGAPEDDTMRKRAGDFIRPLCDPCREALAHEGHGPDETVVLGTSITGCDPKTGRNVLENHDRTIRYEDWEFRCRICYPRSA